MRFRVAMATLAATAIAGCSSTDSPVVPAPAAPAFSVAPLPGKYIVIYNNTVSDTRREIASHVTAQSVLVEHVYDHALHGWAGQVTAAEVQRLRNDPHVAYIEQDIQFTIQTS